MHKTILQAHELFKTAGFEYAICGGFAIDMFAGKELRTHGDFDILVFTEDKHRAVKFMMDHGWPIYGRFLEEGPIWQYLFYKIDDIADSLLDDCRNFWTVKPGCMPEMYKLNRLPAYSYKQPREWLVRELEFVEIAVDIKEGGDYVARENPRIVRPLDKAILYRDGIPYLAPEVILFYKSDKYSSESAYARPRTEVDFRATLPLLSDESRGWLLDAIDLAYPDGHEWLDWLQQYMRP